ncbi:Uncharacterised protein [Serratia fonticola]|nr:Uncharacterised protein [Serratia fonticola]
MLGRHVKYHNENINMRVKIRYFPHLQYVVNLHEHWL